MQVCLFCVSLRLTLKPKRRAELPLMKVKCRSRKYNKNSDRVLVRYVHYRQCRYDRYAFLCNLSHHYRSCEQLCNLGDHSYAYDQDYLEENFPRKIPSLFRDDCYALPHLLTTLSITIDVHDLGNAPTRSGHKFVKLC